MLAKDLLGLLASSNEVRHHLLSRTIREILVYLEVFLSKLPSNLVRESLELAKSDTMIMDVPLEDHFLCFFHTACVVGGDEQQAVAFQVSNYMGQAVVKALVCFLDGVPDGGLVSVLFGQSSLFVHVGASDELDAQVVSENFGASHFVLDDLGHSLGVALIAIHYDVLLVAVEDVRKLLSKGLNGGLHEGLLSVNIEKAVLGMSSFADGKHSLSKRVKDGEVFLGDTNSTANGDSPLQIRITTILKPEEMSVGVEF